MAVSGSKDFEPDVAEYIEEAFERCGLELRTGYDARTARRSLNFLFADWANRGLNQWTIGQVTQSVVSGVTDYPVGIITLTVADSSSFTVGETITGSSSGATTTVSSAVSLEDVQSTIDVLNAVVRRSSEDISINRISRDDYLSIPNKTTTGRPNQYFVDRLITPVMKVWPSPENSTDQIIYDRLTRIDDADVSVNTLEIPFRFYPCLAAGLAYYISLKRSPDRVQLLKGLYEEEFDRAAQEDRDKASVNLVPSFTFVTGV
tara:strand:- start:1199 stop:1981 length:783 start_codon:yes stop_codon:yes gene_type:complete